VLQHFRETKKGWLDYRLESEESSKRLHYIMGRLLRQTAGMGKFLNLALWVAGKEGKRPRLERTKILVAFTTVACMKTSEWAEADLQELEATANLFIESTEGLVKTLKAVTKNDYLKLAGLYGYFNEQHKKVHEMTNAMAEIPPPYKKMKGVSQDLTAAVNRRLNVWKA
jgi:hypothetical protein